ncbi:HlyC/CorC family transporter [bacterium]|nr:HlyC/CorC family transporter [bacterium]
MIYIVIFLFALLLSAFFSGVETGFIRIDPIKVNYLKDHPTHAMQQFTRLLEEKNKILSTMLIGNNLSLIIASTCITSFLLNIVHIHEQESIIATLIVTPVLLLFGEIIPKSFFLHNPIRKVNLLLPLILFFRSLFSPCVWLINFYTRWLINHLLPKRFRTSESVSVEDLHHILKQLRLDSDTTQKEKMYIARVLRFHKTQAKEIMKPLIDVIALEHNATIRQAIELMSSSGYSRLPVYTDSIDSITGIIHAKDLLNTCAHEQINRPLPLDIIKEVVYVPETKRISEILAEFQKFRHELFVVIDEYGASVGVVSLEDVLEEIFGEIYDEYDDDNEEYLFPLGKNTFIVSGRLDVDVFNDRFSCNLPKHNYETLAGFILYLAGRIPFQGETFHFHNLAFTVLKANQMKIDQLKLKIN